MINYLKIPLCSPFKFYQNTEAHGIHFDDDWSFNQIKSFELKTIYKQKWLRSVTTKIQITSTIPPDNLKLYKCGLVLIKQFTWVDILTGVNGEKVYETTIDFTDVVDDGTYYLYQKATLLSADFEFISEPILLADTHKQCLIFTYKNSYNKHDVVFTTGIEYNFICEAGLMEFEPQRSRNAFTDESHDVKTLSSTPYREFKLYIGTEVGVANYVVDLLNRIFSLDYVLINDRQFETTEGSKWEVSRIKGYPLIGASIDVTEAVNQFSLQAVDGLPLSPGVVTAYEIQTNFFGTSTNSSIIEIEQL